MDSFVFLSNFGVLTHGFPYSKWLPSPTSAVGSLSLQARMTQLRSEAGGHVLGSCCFSLQQKGERLLKPWPQVARVKTMAETPHHQTSLKLHVFRPDQMAP